MGVRVEESRRNDDGAVIVEAEDDRRSGEESDEYESVADEAIESVAVECYGEVKRSEDLSLHGVGRRGDGYVGAASASRLGERRDLA